MGHEASGGAGWMGMCVMAYVLGDVTGPLKQWTLSTQSSHDPVGQWASGPVVQ